MTPYYLLISHIQVHNANALSSALTIGVPAVTAFLGFAHALERKIRTTESIHFSKVGICVHKVKVQNYRGENDYTYSLIGTSNPLDAKGERPSFIEEARCDLEISLLLESQMIFPEDFDAVVKDIVQTMKFAGGDIENVKDVKHLQDTEQTPVEKFIKRELMPGYWLIDRSDLIKKAMNEGEEALQALLDYLSLSVHVQKEGSVTSKDFSKKDDGWFVPIAVGFQGLTPLAIANRQRDETTPHCFAEPVITLGEYKMVHRFMSLNEILWEYCFIPETHLYLCQSNC